MTGFSVKIELRKGLFCLAGITVLRFHVCRLEEPLQNQTWKWAKAVRRGKMFCFKKQVPTAGIALEKYFFALIFFQVVVDAFQNQRQLRKKQDESAANREGNGANHKGSPENQGGFRKQDKKPHFQVQNGSFVNPLRFVRMVSGRKCFQNGADMRYFAIVNFIKQNAFRRTVTKKN